MVPDNYPFAALPNGWEEAPTEHSTVAKCMYAFVHEAGHKVFIWGNVKEGGTYGIPKKE